MDNKLITQENYSSESWQSTCFVAKLLLQLKWDLVIINVFVSG